MAAARWQVPPKKYVSRLHLAKAAAASSTSVQGAPGHSKGASEQRTTGQREPLQALIRD